MDHTRLATVRYAGAARGIGGSMLVVEAKGRRLLLDCGRPIGHPSPGYPIDPPDVDAIILSHAHQDHLGWVGDFRDAGFVGPIYCTEPTRGIITVQIGDALGRRGRPESLDEEMRAIVGCKVGPIIETPFGATIQFHRAGHLLGAAGVLVEWCGHRLYFTGDLGRSDSPLYPAPAPLPPADIIVCESTYGDREVEPYQDSEDLLAELALETFDEGGTLIIPAFSLGRIQLVLLAIHRLRLQGQWPDVPIVVDSSTARRFAETHIEFAGELRTPDVVAAWTEVRYAETESESRACLEQPGPATVIVAGGMLDSVRAKQHLKARIDDPRCRIALVCYQAPGTLGHRLTQRGPTVRIDGRSFNKWAQVHHLPGFSGHAGQSELLGLLRPAIERGSAIRLVHGEIPAADALAARLRALGCEDVTIPDRNQVDPLRADAGSR